MALTNEFKPHTYFPDLNFKPFLTKPNFMPCLFRTLNWVGAKGVFIFGFFFYCIFIKKSLNLMYGLFSEKYDFLMISPLFVYIIEIFSPSLLEPTEFWRMSENVKESFRSIWLRTNFNEPATEAISVSESDADISGKPFFMSSCITVKILSQFSAKTTKKLAINWNS